MKESQGQLMPNLTRLPGPRPFNNKKKEVKMEDNKDTIDDIVARTANIIQSGKAFGGWTDNNKNTVKEDRSNLVLKPSAEQLRTAVKKSNLVGGSKLVGTSHKKLTNQLKKLSDGVEHKTTFDNLQELPALLPLAARALPMVGRMAMKAIGSNTGKAIAKAGIRKATGWVEKQKQANTNASA